MEQEHEAKKSARLCLLPKQLCFSGALAKIENELVKTFGDKPIFSLVVRWSARSGTILLITTSAAGRISRNIFLFNIAKREMF